MPIRDQMSRVTPIIHLMTNIFYTIIFFFCLLSFILIYSLMQNDIEERTYELAMLRTLGLKNRNIILIAAIQSLFYAIPGIIMGFLMMFIAQNGIVVAIFHFTEYAA